MTHFIKNLVIGFIGVIIYYFVSIQLIGTKAEYSYAGVILMSPFIFNRQKKDIYGRTITNDLNVVESVSKNKSDSKDNHTLDISDVGTFQPFTLDESIYCIDTRDGEIFRYKISGRDKNRGGWKKLSSYDERIRYAKQYHQKKHTSSKKN